MRRIDRTCLAMMQSPIRHLMKEHLGQSIFRIAPERHAHFETTLNDFDLIYINQRQWKFCAFPDPDRREVFVSRGAIELLWCASLAHMLFYTRMIHRRKFDQPKVIDPQSDERVHTALQLLLWAFRCQVPNRAHLFAPSELRNVRSLADRLLRQKDGQSRALYQLLSDESRQALARYRPDLGDITYLTATLLRDLNQCVENEVIAPIFRTNKFPTSPQVTAFVAQGPQGYDLKLLNRFLLEDTFAQELSQTPIRRDYLLVWPDDLPSPLQAPPGESDENVADELCLVSSAYFLHHELAHIRLHHATFTQEQLRDDDTATLSVNQEKDADIEAAQWILDGLAPENPLFVKRCLGLVQGFLLTTAMGMYGRSLGGVSHPFSYDRLASLLNRFLGDEDHVTKGFAFAILDLHFQNSRRRLRRQTFPGPQEALEALCDQLAEETRAVEEAQGPRTEAANR